MRFVQREHPLHGGLAPARVARVDVRHCRVARPTLLGREAHVVAADEAEAVERQAALAEGRRVRAKEARDRASVMLTGPGDAQAAWQEFIAEEPSPDQLRENGLRRDETMYGLYEGVPLDEWGGDGIPVPTRILLFRLPLEEDYPDPLDLADEVRITILHELAHHLGIEDEDRLSELGID